MAEIWRGKGENLKIQRMRVYQWKEIMKDLSYSKKKKEESKKIQVKNDRKAVRNIMDNLCIWRSKEQNEKIQGKNAINSDIRGNV